MEILEAFDATGSLRAAAELVGCDHKTVGHWVRARDVAGGGLPQPARQRPRVDAFAAKIEEWVYRSRGKVRADVAHQKLVAMAIRARSGRRAGRWPRPSGAGAPSTAAGPGHGSRSPGCGCSSTTATGPRSRAEGRCCSARGWLGAGFGW